MNELTFQQYCGYALCLAGAMIVLAALASYVAWEWGILGLPLFVFGCLLLHSSKDASGRGGFGDLGDDVIDLTDID